MDADPTLADFDKTLQPSCIYTSCALSGDCDATAKYISTQNGYCNPAESACVEVETVDRYTQSQVYLDFTIYACVSLVSICVILELIVMAYGGERGLIEAIQW